MREGREKANEGCVITPVTTAGDWDLGECRRDLEFIPIQHQDCGICHKAFEASLCHPFFGTCHLPSPWATCASKAREKLPDGADGNTGGIWAGHQLRLLHTPWPLIEFFRGLNEFPHMNASSAWHRVSSRSVLVPFLLCSAELCG